MLVIFIFILTVVACQGNAVPEERDARIGNFNSYYFYNKQRPLEPIDITNINTWDLDAISFNPELTTVFIVHGHGGTAFTTLNPLLKDAFFSNYKEEEVNVIVVDWSVYAGQSYSNAVNAVPSAGKYLADFIQTVFVPNRLFLLRNVHLIGFNLGAHFVGETGRRLFGQVGRITGLDPSGSQWGSNSGHLNRNDALYVEVIHTDGRGLFANGIGQPLGHVDFFVNGGSSQPGCFTNSCCHNRAYEVFASSLTHGNLIGNSCNTNLQLTLNTCRGGTLEMGTNQLVKFGSGIYRVNTNRRYPF